MTNFNLLLVNPGLCPPVSHHDTHLFDPSTTLGGFLYLPTVELHVEVLPPSQSCLLQSSFSFPLSNRSGIYWLGRLQAGFRSSPQQLVHLTPDHFPLFCLWLSGFGKEEEDEEEKEREKEREPGIMGWDITHAEDKLNLSLATAQLIENPSEIFKKIKKLIVNTLEYSFRIIGF